MIVATVGFHPQYTAVGTPFARHAKPVWVVRKIRTDYAGPWFWAPWPLPLGSLPVVDSLLLFFIA